MAQRFAVMCAEDMLGRSPAPNPRFQALTDLFCSFCKDCRTARSHRNSLNPPPAMHLSSCSQAPRTR